MTKSKKTFIIFLIGFIIGVIGFTGSFLMYSKPSYEEIKDNSIGDITTSNIIFTSIDDSVYIEDAIPTLDKFGVESKGFSFSIRNNTNTSREYQLRLADNGSTINNKYIRYELIKNNKILGVYSLDESGILEKNTITSNDEINYTIKVWLDYNSDVRVGRVSKKIAIDELDDKNEVNKPILASGMIPVYYDDKTSGWYKSDNNNWYNYDEGKWANVVTVASTKRDYYINSEVGTKIEIEDVNSMWVWIPRYSYSLDNEKVNVLFVNKEEKAYSAFTFNNEELSGFWFNKFESSMKDDSECIKSSLTKKCNNSNNKLYFVPNYTFSNKITMANMFYAIRKMELKDNIYGFNGTGNKLNNDGTIEDDVNNIDIHMIKNTEWQAVALLSSSKYGKNGNNKYDNKTITNNNSLIAGKSYFDNELYDYDVSIKGETASTTGTIYGVYDMSGGKREYVMVNNNELNIFDKNSNSGFTTIVKECYYDNGFNDDTITKHGQDNLINNEPITRGGYKNTGNIFTIYGANDYIDKISVETNSRASLVIIEGEE